MKKRANYFCGINSAKVLQNIEENDFNEDAKEYIQNWIMYDYWMRSIMNRSSLEKKIGVGVLYPWRGFS